MTIEVHRLARADILRTLTPLTADTLGVAQDSLALDTELSRLGADSLDMVELGMNIEDAFGIEIPQRAYNSFRTLGDALAYIEHKLGLEPEGGEPLRESPVPAAREAFPRVRTRPRPNRSRVVITGMGALTPLGLDVASTFAALLRGESGVRPWSGGNGESFDVRIAAEVPGFDACAVLGDKQARRHARFTQLACAAALEAVRDARLEAAEYRPERIATVMGVGMGGIEHFFAAAGTLLREGPRRVSPIGLVALVPNMAAAAVARQCRAFGPSFSVASACASSGNALSTALDLLRAGRADAVLAGGAEACVTPLAIACFSRMGALSRRNHAPARASRPFDRDRDGFVIGEGAGVLVLETLERARARGATIYAELAGTGASADAYHDTQPDPEGRGAELAIRSALEDADLEPERVDYVNAHATGTTLGDRAETYALKRSFGAHVSRLCVSSTKSMTGHLLGAAGAVETIVTVLALARGELPPTINLDHPDTECDLDYIAGTARRMPIEVAINNTFGFGGQNATLVLRRVP